MPVLHAPPPSPGDAGRRSPRTVPDAIRSPLRPVACRAAVARPGRAALLAGLAALSQVAAVPSTSALLTAALAVTPASAQEAGATSAGGATLGSASQDSGQGAGLQNTGPPGVPPIAGAVLPATGLDASQPGLRDRLLGAFGQAQAPLEGVGGPSWKFYPSILVSESFTDNPNQFGGYNFGLQHHGDDAITQIQPELLIVGDTERFQVHLDYAPTGVIYAANSDESQFRQQFNGSVLATAVPDFAYLDTRASVTQVPVYGGLGVVTPDILPPSQRQTESILSATPYLVHEFGGTGTLQAGVGYIYSASDSPDYLNGGGNVPLALGYNYGSQWLATRRVFASFTTGEDYGRFKDELNTDNSFYDGSSALRGAHRVLLTDDVSYAIDRFISALGEFGYENLDYPASAFSYVGGVWAAGARITPNGQSSLTLEYRRIDGLDSPYAYGFWQITPRIRLFGSYSEGITTFQQDEQNSLLAGTDSLTGAAASADLAGPLFNNAQLFGSNQALTRSERATASLAYVAGRDIVTGAFNHQRSSLVGNLLGLPTSVLANLGISNAELAQYGLLTTQTSVTTLGTVSWQHDWLPDVNSDVLVGYSRSSVAQTSGGDYSAVQFSVGVNKEFTSTITGRVAYFGNYAVGGQGIGDFGQNSNTILVSVRKTF